MGELGNLFVLYLITEEALIDDFLQSDQNTASRLILTV